jgi:hypothetical protein
MRDVLRRLGNRTLTFVGDSLSVQVGARLDRVWDVVSRSIELSIGVAGRPCIARWRPAHSVTGSGIRCQWPMSY